MCVTYTKLLLHLIPHISLVGILASIYVMDIYQLLQPLLPWVKATAASVRLRIYLFALTNANTLLAGNRAAIVSPVLNSHPGTFF